MSNNSQSGGGTGGTGSTPGGRSHIQSLKMLANGRYRLMNQAGRGGMSVVYHAYDTQNDRDVAIKILSLDLALEDSFLARFRRESELMRDMQHPNILRAYDYGQDGEIIYLVMSYYGGGTLKARMNGPVPLGAAANYLAQVAAGLGYAHARNIVHRDVKPSNVLIHHASDNLVLSDFGIAKALSNSNLQRTGTIMGTPLYMAPEQFLDRVDQRTDIYSLGVMLYQMLTGEVPFKGEGIGFKHLNDPVPPMVAFGVSYDPAIEAVVQKALAKRPEARYQHVEEMAAAFTQAVQDYGESQTAFIDLAKPTMLTKVDKVIASQWAEQVNQEALPGQAEFSALPVLEPRVEGTAPQRQSIDGAMSHKFPPFRASVVNNPEAVGQPPATYSQPSFTPSRPVTPPNSNSVPYRPTNYNPTPYQSFNGPPLQANSYQSSANPQPTFSPALPSFVPPPALSVSSAVPNQGGPRWLVIALVAVLVLGLGALGTGVLLFLAGQNNSKATATSVANNTPNPNQNITSVATTNTANPNQTTSNPIVTNTTNQNPTAAPNNSITPTSTGPATTNPVGPITPPVNAPAKDFEVLYVSQVTTNTKVIFSFVGKTGERKALTDVVTGTQDTNPVWVNSQTIVFQSDRDKGRAALYKMSADGSAATKIIDNAYSPAVYPYGNIIVYVSSNDNNIYEINFPSTNPKQLTHDTHKKLGPTFSPDGTKLVYSIEDDNHIYQIHLLDLNNPKANAITLVQSSQVHCLYPVFSPDGTKIAYNTAAINPKDDEDRLPLDIFTYQIGNKETPTNLTNGQGHNSRPVWLQDNRGSGDRSRLYFNSDRGAGEWARIFVMNTDGTSQNPLILDKATNGDEQKVDDYAPSVWLLN